MRLVRDYKAEADDYFVNGKYYNIVLSKKETRYFRSWAKKLPEESIRQLRDKCFDFLSNDPRIQKHMLGGYLTPCINFSHRTSHRKRPILRLDLCQSEGSTLPGLIFYIENYRRSLRWWDIPLLASL